MSLFRINPKRDRTEPLIVEYFEKCGCLVIRLSGRGTPDLLCGYRQVWFLVECKTEAERLTQAQRTFFSEVRKRSLPAFVCRNIEDCELALATMRSLS